MDTDKYDITFTAKNANTIEAGKATVTVDGTVATLTRGKLKQVQTGSTVTITAAEGYIVKSLSGNVEGEDVSQPYSGNTTWFGSKDKIMFYWAIYYTPDMLPGNILKAIKISTRDSAPITLTVRSGGDSPNDKNGEVLYTETLEETAVMDLNNWTLNQPVRIDPTKNLWLIFQQSCSYSVFAGRQPENNSCSWFSTDGSNWTPHAGYAWIVLASIEPANIADGSNSASFKMVGEDMIMNYDLRRDMKVDVNAEIASRICIKKEKNVYVPVTPTETVPVITDVLGNDSTPMTDTIDYTTMMQKLDDDNQWSTATGLSVGTFRFEVTGTGLYDGICYTNEFQLLEGYKVEVPAGEYVTYFKDDNLKVKDTDVKLYTITSVNATEATVTEIPSANTKMPFLIFNSSNEKKTVLLIPTDDVINQVYATEFVGTLKATTIATSDETTDNYTFNGKEFERMENDIPIAANRAWLTIPTGANAHVIKLISSEAASINEEPRMKSEESAPTEWYDLNGRKLQGIPAKKGVYILDGRKVVVK